MTFGDLFAGIGGFRLGLERAGHECNWACEIDPFCRKVYSKHWPKTDPFYEDICKVENPPYVDMLCGGFPCQDLSYAGKGAGIDGTRSGLWGEFGRLIRVVRPRVVVVENVPALLNRGLERVLADLAESGYDAEWDCIPASAVGAPHRRDRVWIVAHTNSIGNRIKHRSDQNNAPKGRSRKIDDSRGRGNDRREYRPGPDETLANANSPRCKTGTARQVTGRPVIFAGEDEARTGQWSTEPNVGRVAHGVPSRVDRLKGLGNAVVPQVVEWIGRRLR